jgi:exodeoxyribonuclease VII large subunit
MPSILSVTAFTRDLRTLLEAEFDSVWVEGELSNFTRAASGHCYFSLKDDEAQIRCVMWKHLTKYVFFEPEDGMQVRVNGHASVYERRGTLQIQVQAMRQAGKGAQQEAYERLKAQLQDEGLFAAKRKQPLPRFPDTVGVVTSGDGAALHDIRSVLERRFPAAQVVLCPVPVQGLDAPPAIADAIRAFNALPPGEARAPDVLIVGRGGGSTEDLWAFNDERVARAAAASLIPIVSAVGHESDVCILDFVADRRAATPSMAAEVATPNGPEVAEHVRALGRRLRRSMEQRLATERQRVDRLLHAKGLRLPHARLDQHRQTLDRLMRDLQRAARRTLEHRAARVDALRNRLRALDPDAPLRRGYAAVSHEGTPVRDARSLRPGDTVVLQFRDGNRTATVAQTAPPATQASGSDAPRHPPEAAAASSDEDSPAGNEPDSSPEGARSS